MPKNAVHAFKVLESALDNARTKQDQQSIEYTLAYMHKILAVQEGNAEKLNATQKEMMRLCKEDMPVALVDYYTVQCGTRAD